MKKLALSGTMDTSWREKVIAGLGDSFDILDNIDVAWEKAVTAEAIEPLLEHDLDLLREADVVLWHHDEGQGRTARIELGYLAALSDHEGSFVIIHVEAGVKLREYMKAITKLHPNMRWADSWEDVFLFLGKL